MRNMERNSLTSSFSSFPTLPRHVVVGLKFITHRVFCTFDFLERCSPPLWFSPICSFTHPPTQPAMVLLPSGVIGTPPGNAAKSSSIHYRILLLLPSYCDFRLERGRLWVVLVNNKEFTFLRSKLVV